MQQNILTVMDDKGDTKHFWDPSNEVEVSAVENVFSQLVSKGYMAARMNKDGSSGALIKKFNSKAGSILMMPPVRGG